MINPDHDSSLRKWANFTGTGRKDAGNALKPSWKPWKSTEHRSSIPKGMSPDFSGDFRWKRTGSWPELTEKFLKHPVRNTASMLHWFSVFYSRNWPVSFDLGKIQMFFCAFDHYKMWDIVRYCLYYERT
jgi:hypothetical protein